MTAVHKTLGRPPRVLYLLSHPIQYQAPMLRHFADSGRIDVHTLYIRNIREDGYFDAGFGATVQWDVPLTTGYSHDFLPSLGRADRVTRLRPVLCGLSKAASRWKPDAVWVHGYDHINAIRLMAWAKRHGVTVLARSDVEWSNAHGGRVARAFKKRALERAFPLIDGFLAIGRRNAEFYRDHGVPDEKMFRVPYAVDNARFAAARDGGDTDDLSREYGLPEGRPVFVMPAKLIPLKRPDDAIRALVRLKQEHGVTANLVIAGTGEMENSLRELTATLGLSGQVAFAGFVNQRKIAALYSQSTSVLLVSDRERWGLVANEAMAAGTPMIVSDRVGCADDLVVDGISGRVVPTGDVTAIADAMAGLSGAEERAMLAKGAIKQVSMFSYSAVEDGIVDALEALT